MNRITIGFIIGFFLSMGVAGYFDAENERFENEQYCEMVGIWTKQAKEGIEQHYRDGWPPYKGTDICKNNR